MTHPEGFLRIAIAAQTIAIFLVWLALTWDAPLEGLADPMHTPNPAKAPWYFLGLQELLHYFPPVVAGVLVPGLVVLALVVIPYFNINIESDGLFLKNRDKRLRIFGVVTVPFCVFSWWCSTSGSPCFRPSSLLPFVLIAALTEPQVRKASDDGWCYVHSPSG